MRKIKNHSICRPFLPKILKIMNFSFPFHFFFYLNYLFSFLFEINASMYTLCNKCITKSFEKAKKNEKIYNHLNSIFLLSKIKNSLISLFPFLYDVKKVFNSLLAFLSKIKKTLLLKFFLSLYKKIIKISFSFVF